MNSSKDKILNNLRAALKNSDKLSLEELKKQLKQYPENHNIPTVLEDKSIYSDYSDDHDDMLNQFITRQQNLHGEVILCRSLEDMIMELKKTLDPLGSSSIAYVNNDIIEQLVERDPDLGKIFNQNCDLTISSPEFAEYEVGISGADYLVARTGSIFLNSTTAGGRRLTVLPPVHIVLARRSQMVPSLDNVLSRINQQDLEWSYATFITGPSRTSDIEKKLVLGAHGPKQLITIILD